MGPIPFFVSIVAYHGSRLAILVVHAKRLLSKKIDASVLQEYED